MNNGITKVKFPQGSDKDKTLKKLHVKNVAFEATRKELRQLFSPFEVHYEIVPSVLVVFSSIATLRNFGLKH